MSSFANCRLKWLALLIIATACAGVVAVQPPSHPATQPTRKPNIVFIYADDLGYGDLGCYGAKAIKTPNLDRMATEGLRLTSFYSVAPVCTPSRAALLTGRYCARMGSERMNLPNVLMPASKEGLPQEETTVARALKARGYATACFGKWHLGHLAPHRAIDHGFDYYFGIPYSNDMRPSPLMRNAEQVEEPADQDTITLRCTQEAIGFIEHNKNQAFFVYFPHHMPHIPLHASPAFRGKSVAGLYGDAVEEVDWSVGQVLATLKRLGLDRDTIVFFSSDNGPWFQGSPGPLRGRKGWTHDGGIREPGIVRWPGRIKPRVADEPIATLDFFATALALAGEASAQSATKLPLDGRNVLPFLLGEVKSPPEHLYVFFDTVYLQTARIGRWKIHVQRWNIPRYVGGQNLRANVKLAQPELYDMTYDLGESYNLAAQHPDVVRELQGKIAERLRTFPEEIQKANAGLL